MLSFRSVREGILGLLNSLKWLIQIGRLICIVQENPGIFNSSIREKLFFPLCLCREERVRAYKVQVPAKSKSVDGKKAKPGTHST